MSVLSILKLMDSDILSSRHMVYGSLGRAVLSLDLPLKKPLIDVLENAKAYLISASRYCSCFSTLVFRGICMSYLLSAGRVSGGNTYGNQYISQHTQSLPRGVYRILHPRDPRGAYTERDDQIRLL